MSTSQQTPNTVQNQIILIHLVMRIELTQAILIPQIVKFSEKFDHPFSHVFKFGNIFPECHGSVDVPVTGRTISSPFTS